MYNICMKEEIVMNNARVIGNNIALELKKKSIDISFLAERIGFSLSDIHKLLEGRLLLPPFQLKKLAQVLNTTKEELMRVKEQGEYNDLIYNFRNFKNVENQELVLDLIDMYADLEEALEK